MQDLPINSVRQKVLPFPWSIRGRLLYDNDLTSEVLGVFVVTVHAWPREVCNGRGQPGAVTVIQRFGSALRANLHLHTLMPHGTYVERPDGEPSFLAAPAPTHADIERLTETVATRVYALLDRRGLGDNVVVKHIDLHIEDGEFLVLLGRAVAGRLLRRRGDEHRAVRTRDLHQPEAGRDERGGAPRAR